VRLAGEYARQFVASAQSSITASVRKAQEEVQAKTCRAAPSWTGEQLPVQIARGERTRSLRPCRPSPPSVSPSSATLTKPSTSRRAPSGRGRRAPLRPPPRRRACLCDRRGRYPDPLAGGIGEQLRLPLLARVPPPPRRLAKASLLVTLAQPGGHTRRRTGCYARTSSSPCSTRTLAHSSSPVPPLARGIHDRGQPRGRTRGGESRSRSSISTYGAPTGPILRHADCARGLRRRAGPDQPRGSAPAIDLGARSNGMNGSDSEIGSLSVLVSGPIPPNPGEFAGRGGSLRSWTSCAPVSRFVSHRTPRRLLGVGDAMTLSSDVERDRARHTAERRAQADACRGAALLDSSPAPTLGVGRHRRGSQGRSRRTAMATATRREPPNGATTPMTPWGTGREPDRVGPLPGFSNRPSPSRRRMTARFRGPPRGPTRRTYARAAARTTKTARVGDVAG
jgi:hypothetical protein